MEISAGDLTFEPVDWIWWGSEVIRDLSSEQSKHLTFGGVLRRRVFEMGRKD